VGVALPVETAKVEALLASYTSAPPHIESETGTRDGYAYRKFWRHDSKHNFAVVWSPGDRWFSLDIQGGYSNTHFEEGASDDQVLQRVEALMGLALSYLEGSFEVSRSRFLRLPRVNIAAGQHRMELTLSLSSALKYLLRLRTA
jgi:hypothetical protein